MRGAPAPAGDLPTMVRDPFVGARTRADSRGPRMRRLLLATDMAVVCIAVLAVEAAARSFWGSSLPVHVAALFAVLGVPAWLVLAHGAGLYHVVTHRVEHGMAEEAGPIVRVTTAWAWGVVLVGLALGMEMAWIEQIAVLWAAIALFAGTGRALARAYARRQAWYVQNALVLDVTPHAVSVVRKILRHPECRINIVAAVDPDGEMSEAELVGRFGHVPVVPGVEGVGQLIENLDVDRVIVGWRGRSKDRDDLLHELAAAGVHIDLIPNWFDAVGARVDIHELEGSPMMALPRAELSRSSQLLKRGLDLGLSLAGLVVLTPFFLACALAIKLESAGPVFFRQVRVGRDGSGFRVFKFRSMHVDAEERKAEVAPLSFHGDLADGGMFKIRDDPRVTRVGRLLRRYSLDELPQLINVLRGEMSLVGPRPLIEDEANPIAARFRHRLSLTPGLTGLWQVNGRSDIPFEEMVSLDYLYVTNWSLWGDMKLLLKTLPAVTAGRGAY